MFKVSEKYMRQYFIAITVNILFLSIGWSIAWSSPVLLKLSNTTQTVLDEPLTPNQGSWIVSVSSILGIPSSLISGTIADLIGRKYFLLGSQIPKLIAWIMTYFATNVWSLYIARALHGLSDGSSLVIVPMYIAEISMKELRGSLGSLLQIFITLGIVLMYCIGPYLEYHAIAIIGIVLSSLPLVMIIVPESPQYCIKKGNSEGALQSLTYLRGSTTEANEELKILEASITADAVGKLKLRQLISTGASTKGLILAIILAMASQFGGYNAIMSYMQSILELSGSELSSQVSSVILGLVQMFGSILTMSIANRVGRKIILSTSALTMAVGMFGLGLVFNYRESNDTLTGVLNYVPLTSFIIIVLAYATGFGSLIWPLMSELFSEETRSTGASISTCCIGICLFISQKFFIQILQAIGPYITYVTFGFINFLIFLFVILFIPETMNKSTADIQNIMEKRTIYCNCK